MTARPSAFVLAAVAALGLAADATAGVITIANPGGTNDIGARMRWGATGFEASVYDVNPFVQNPTLNPAGTPAWSVGNPHPFRVEYSSVTGAITLSVDFNRNGSFGAGETISQSVFAAPGQTSYAGTGFGYLEVNGNETGSTGRSTITGLTINGTSIPTLQPNGGLLQQFFTDDTTGLITSLTATGELTFLNSGTSQERPSWNFILGNAGIPAQAAAVPEPATLTSLGLLAGGGAVMLRRRSRTPR